MCSFIPEFSKGTYFADMVVRYSDCNQLFQRGDFMQVLDLLWAKVGKPAMP